MAHVQKYFEQFHGLIALGRFDEETTLRQKRDIIRQKLNDRLPREFEAHDEECPAFDFADQGSYALGTGIKPIAGDFDIDQGLYFDLEDQDFGDPVVLKKRVRDALEGHTNKVLIRRSCVTVFYQSSGEDIYHVDLAIYRRPQFGGFPKIGKGKEFSKPENRLWETSDPAGLAEWVKQGLDEDGRRQLRRLIRYMKRWKDERFTSAGNGAPAGIALTVAIRSSFSVCYSDALAKKPDDLGALKSAIDGLLARFVAYIDTDGNRYHRATVPLPVQPYNDLFARLTDMQSEDVYQKLLKLQDANAEAQKAVDPVVACKKLQAVFGSDFPVPDPEETASKAAPTILGSSSSA